MSSECSGRQVPYVGAGNSADQDSIVPLTLKVDILRIARDSEAGVEEAGTQRSQPHMESVLLLGDSDMPQVCSLGKKFVKSLSGESSGIHDMSEKPILGGKEWS